MRAFLFAGRALTAHDTSFGEALAAAHRARARPLCLCTGKGVAMYVARLGAGFVLKRMPGTGSLHAPGCPSKGPPIVPTPIGTLPTTGEEDGSTSLAVSFSLAKRIPPPTAPQSSEPARTSTAQRDGLTLAGFLHYLWNEAELNKWQPSFAGRRSWATVRRRLLAASLGKTIGPRPLTELLYIPEVFSVERRREIRERRLAAWAPCVQSPEGTGRLMVLIGELKQVTPTSYGSRIVIKHVPDRSFRDEQDGRRWATWNLHANAKPAGRDGRHWLVVATFSANVVGMPFIEEATAVPTNRYWLLEDAGFSAHIPSAALRSRWTGSDISDHPTVNP